MSFYRCLAAIGLLLGTIFSTGCGNAVNKANQGATLGHGFVIRTLPGSERKYGVFVPHSYDGSREYPTILFLHGLFEGGDNPDKAFNVGLGPAIADRAATFGYIAIFPQSHGDWKEKSPDLADAYRALQDVKAKYKVDNSRVFLTGLSIGGYGCWALAEQHPSEFAALVPMCGYDKVDAVPAIKHIPTWIFHNSLDPFVSVGDSKAMEAAIKKAGGTVQLTTYPAFGHDVWVRAYQEESLWTWLNKQRKSGSVATR